MMGEAFSHKAQPKEKKERMVVNTDQLRVKNFWVHLLITEK